MGQIWKRIDRKDNCGNTDEIGNIYHNVFNLLNKATLKNVIIGPNSNKYVNCPHGECTLENVWWEDACNNAITLKSDFPIPKSYFYIKGGGVRNARGNIIQHNSASKVYIENFYVENSEQLYSSCENCRRGSYQGNFGYQGKRFAYMTNVTALNVETLAGYNSNFLDIVTLQNIRFTGKHVCKIIEGRDDGEKARVLGYKCESTSISKCVCN